MNSIDVKSQGKSLRVTTDDGRLQLVATDGSDQ